MRAGKIQAELLPEGDSVKPTKPSEQGSKEPNPTAGKKRKTRPKKKSRLATQARSKAEPTAPKTTPPAGKGTSQEPSGPERPSASAQDPPANNPKGTSQDNVTPRSRDHRGPNQTGNSGRDHPRRSPDAPHTLPASTPISQSEETRCPQRQQNRGPYAGLRTLPSPGTIPEPVPTRSLPSRRPSLTHILTPLELQQQPCQETCRRPLSFLGWTAGQPGDPQVRTGLTVSASQHIQGQQNQTYNYQRQTNDYQRQTNVYQRQLKNINDRRN